MDQVTVERVFFVNEQLRPQRHTRTATSAASTVRDGYKRPFDLLIIGFGLVLLAPLWVLLGIAIPLAIRIDDAGPALYRQKRLGRDGVVFELLKFRTMNVDAEAKSGPVWTERGDARVTGVGRVLRRFHLDELPQAVNILRGEMSLVGPRPERPELVAKIEETVPDFSSRLRVRPGIAGLAQFHGASWHDPALKLHYDNLYIASMNPWFDLKLGVFCVMNVFRRRDSRRAPRTIRLPRRAQ